MNSNPAVFGVLGPLQVWDGSRTVLARGTKRDLLLATLLLRANRFVPVEELVEAVWQTPPRSALANVHTYVSGLRLALPPPPSSGARLERSRHGYLLRAEPEEIDAGRFQHWVAEAEQHRAQGAYGEALALLERALGLWRGHPLAGMPAAPAWQDSVEQLVTQHRAARELRTLLLLRQEQYESATAELRALVEEDPFREELWGQLIRVLGATGQRAAALRTYQRARALLVAELGIEPGPALRQAHTAVLRGHGRDLLSDAEPAGTSDEATAGDPDVAVPVAPAGSATAATGYSGEVLAPEPAMLQLPPDIADFTGRAADVAALLDRLDPLARAAGDGGAAGDAGDRGDRGDAPTIAVVVGPPGVGKSTLAVHAAHRLTARYPDGQLYVELDGTAHPDRGAGEALAELLRTLGVAGTALPDSVAGRAARYRSLIRGRRVLVVLDDAAGADQVRALLPPDGGSALLVTARRRVPGLPGAHELDLDVLPPDDARALLGRLIGAERVGAERGEADRIIEACGRLPLGIRIAGARLAGRRPWSLRTLADRLRDRTGRLDELSVGDLGVRASFDLSVRSLPPSAARAFARLGPLGPVELPGWVVGRLLDQPDGQPELDALIDASLVRVTGPDAAGEPRYRLHDLLRVFAAESAAAEDPAVRREALVRVLAGWLALAERAAAGLPPCVFRPGPGRAPRWRPDPALLDLVTARPLAWFDAERAALVNAVELAAAAGLDELAWELAATMMPYLDLRGYLDEWQRAQRGALRAVRAAGNRRGEAALLRGLGQVALYQDRYDEAYELLDLSRRLARELGDPGAEAVAVAGLGTVDRVVGDPLRAIRSYRRALASFVATGNRHAEAQARNGIGMVYRSLGDLGRARSWLTGALRLATEVGDQHRVACVLTQIGELQLAENSPYAALRTLHRAQTLFRSLEDDRCRAYTIEPLARALIACDQPDAAIVELDWATGVLHDSGDRRGEAMTTSLLATLYGQGQDRTAGERYLRRSALLWREVDPNVQRLPERDEPLLGPAPATGARAAM
ncbi:BTAD domain-containing putative transcriptional regulator [Micromonospora sp. NPDC049559]|uniref:AfsR/SARP family transcriptional regulator n=1 Tax=Micromonospora sp. NPDC049559 TaxID=3155923 RepID=UPI003420C4B4